MKTPLFAVAAATLLVLPGAGMASDTAAGDSILVTATRLDEVNTRARGNTTIITSQDIANSTARTLPELLGREAGVLSRSLYGNNGVASSVDIRGFGAAATQNTLILIDGRRLNDVDLSSVNYGNIPLQSIERIEITRNSGAVLYGDGAVGGAINIITRSPDSAGTTAFIKAGAGNLDTQQLDASISHAGGPFAAYVGVHGINSDGYRDNNDLEERNLNSDFRYSTGNSQWFLRFNWYDQELGLPGARLVNPALGIDQLADDRRGTSTPDDYADQKGYNINPGFSVYWDNGTEAIIDLGYRNKSQQAFFGDYDFGGLFSRYLDSDLKTLSFTPRVITPHTLLNRDSQTIAGLDYYDHDYDSDRAQNRGSIDMPIHHISIDQQTAALYVDNTTTATENTTLNLGARIQWVSQTARDRFDPIAPGADPVFDNQAPDYDDDFSVYMLEAGIEQQLAPGTSGYLKWTRSARIATVDELFEFDPATFTRVFSPLDPQTGNGIDLGTHYREGRYSGTANLYYMRLKDEIQFNPLTFENVNLDPTERYGVELSGSMQMTASIRLLGSYTYMRSKFTDGPYDGNDVPLVPKNKASLSGIWQATPATDLTVSINYVDERLFDNDQANDFGEQIPAYTTVDAKLVHTWRGIRMTAELNNMFEEEFYEYGVSSTFSPGVYNAYPLPERTVLFTIAKEFSNTP